MQGRRSLRVPLRPNLFATLPLFRPRRGILTPFQERIMEEGAEDMDPQDGNVQDPEVRLEMREFARPMMALPGNPIVLGQVARNYELKSTHLNMLPTFHGLPSEDALGFIRDFYQVIQQMPLHNLNEDQLRLRCFPHCLKDRAKNWLNALQEGSIQTWEACFEQFVTKFYSRAKTTQLRQRLATFSQHDDEAFHETFDRFKQLEIECPHHRYLPEMINQFFYDGLTPENQCLVDAAAGGTVGRKTAREMRELFEMMSSNSQQRSVRGHGGRRAVHGASEISAIAAQMERMHQDMQKLLQGNTSNHASSGEGRMRKQQCNACGAYGHAQNQCNGPEEDEEDDVYAQAHWLNNQYDNQRQGGRGVYSNSYNNQWRNHPNFSWRNQNNAQNQQQQQGNNFQKPFIPNNQHFQGNAHQQHGQSSAQPRPMEETMQEMVRRMESMQEEFNRERESNHNTIRRLELQLGQVASKRQDMRNGKLPSQSEHAKVLHGLRSGKFYDNGVHYNPLEEERERRSATEGPG